jgi:hypothetical protein
MGATETALNNYTVRTSTVDVSPSNSMSSCFRREIFGQRATRDRSVGLLADFSLETNLTLKSGLR